MKKALTILLVVLLMLTLAVGLTACNPCKKGSHRWEEDSAVTTTPATCTEDGLKTVFCGRCGATKEEPLPKTDHVPVTVGGTPATCTTAGTSDGVKCSVCETVLTEQQVIPLLGHNYGNVITGTPATCLADGTADYYECSACHKLFVDDGSQKKEVTEAQLVLPKTDHSYGELIGAVAASCGQEGTVAHYHCSVCNKDFADKNGTVIDNVVIPALVHTWKLATANVWTWANDYSSVTLSLVCTHNSAHTTTVTLSGEDIAVDDSSAPTCAADGEIVYSVSLTKQALESKLSSGKLADDFAATLSEVKRVPLPQTSHDYVGQTWQYDGNGGHYQECKYDCGTHSTSQSCTPSLTWDDDDHWTECTVCHDLKTIKTTHDFDDEEDWETDEHGHWYVCKEDGCEAQVLYEDHVYGTVYGHNDEEHWNKCSVCDYEDEDNTSGHSMLWFAEAATHEGLCDVCGMSVDEEDHHVTDGNRHAAEPSNDCRSMGTLAYDYCDVCGYYIVGGATYGEDEVAEHLSDGRYGSHVTSQVAGQDVTCTSNGVVAHWHCSVCNKNFQEEEGINEIANVVIQSQGHQYGEAVWAHNSSDTFGSHHMDCDVCGENGRKTASCSITANVCATCQHTYQVDEILTALFALDSGKSLAGTFELEGVVTAIVTEYNEKYGNVTVDITINGQVIRVYRVEDVANNATVHVKDIAVGSTIKVLGTLTNYNGIREFAEGCTLQSLQRVSYDVNVEIEPAGNATVVDADTELALERSYYGGTEVKFKVNVTNAAYAVQEVKVNGTKAKATGGVYTFKVTGIVTIHVQLADASTVQPDPEVVASLSFVGDANENDEKISGYDKTWKATRDGITWTLVNFNNNSNNWDFVRGCSKNNKTATITTDAAMSYAITQVTVKIQSVQKNNGTFSGVKLIVARDSNFTDIVEEVTGAAVESGEITLEITSPEANCYYKLEVNCSAVSTNGVVQVAYVDYYAVLCQHNWVVDTEKADTDEGWTWDVDNGEGTATAALKCSRCGDVREETVDVEYSTSYTDCTSNGSGIYTATVNGNLVGTHTVSIAPKGHTQGNLINTDAAGHYHVCAECSAQIEAEKTQHTYLTYSNNGDGKHTASCSECGYAFEGTHTWGTVPTYVDEDTHAILCTARGCGASQNSEGHNFNQADGTKCVCGAEQNHEHDFEGDWEKDVNGHWKECPTDQAKDQQGSHVSSWVEYEGGHREVCATCGWVMTERQEHSYSNFQYVDEDHHSGYCATCDTTNRELDHRYGDWTRKDDDDHVHTCADCRNEETESHSWSQTPVQATTSQHKFTCACGAEKFENHDFGTANSRRNCACGEEWCVVDDKGSFVLDTSNSSGLGLGTSYGSATGKTVGDITFSYSNLASTSSKLQMNSGKTPDCSIWNTTPFAANISGITIKMDPKDGDVLKLEFSKNGQTWVAHSELVKGTTGEFSTSVALSSEYRYIRLTYAASKGVLYITSITVDYGAKTENHVWERHATLDKDATCTDSAVLGYICARCQTTKTEVDSQHPATGHSWKVDTTKGDNGWTWDVANGQGSATVALKCDKCNGTREETVEASYSTSYEDCTSNGVGTYTATVEDTWTGTHTESIDPKGHTYVEDEWEGENDPQGHWHVCSECDQMVESAKIAHVYTQYDDLDDGEHHWSICDKCNYLLEEEDHAWSEIPRYVDDEHHETYCTAPGCGATQEAQSHQFTDGPCVCGAQEGHVHDWDEENWTHDEFTHWHACKNGDCTVKKDESTGHTYVWAVQDDGHHEVCNVCNRERTAKQAHDSLTYDVSSATKHIAHCGTCGTDLTQDHTYVYAPKTDDETKHHVSCQFCNWAGTDESHNFVGNNCKDCNAVKPQPKEVELNFVTNFSTYAKSWGNSYESKTLSAADLGVSNIVCSIVLGDASKQGSTISDRPVTKTKKITVTVENVSITKVDIDFLQWTTKALGTLSLKITYSGGTATLTGNSNFSQTFDLSSYQGVTKLEFSSSNSSNQAGLTSIKLSVA